ncbi:hypothetical protein PVAP13_9KG461853 [Panicum virgatum]|uniref:Uncharacterized protein n=1 Tax=Panicum virgatum TaxID=38727 RepID=A0A8T0NG29_PANVG|nr:hypothetical protein PVAP13_9KG461853 [Panicum virgatum]
MPFSSIRTPKFFGPPEFFQELNAALVAVRARTRAAAASLFSVGVLSPGATPGPAPTVMTDGESTDLRNFLPAEKSRTAEPGGSSRPTKKKRGSRQARVAHVGVDLLGSDGFFLSFFL